MMDDCYGEDFSLCSFSLYMVFGTYFDKFSGEEKRENKILI